MVGAESGHNPFGSKHSFLFSNSLPISTEYHLVSGEIEGNVQSIKKEKGKDIWLFGGAQLTTSLLAFNLVDELLLAVHPIVLGKGKPLFADLPARCSLELIDSKPYSSGLVQLHYQILPNQH